MHQGGKTILLEICKECKAFLGLQGQAECSSPLLAL